MRVTDVHHRFGDREVLCGVEIECPRGTVVGIVGENGAGKTTLLRILSGQLVPDRGTVACTGSVGYCPQRIVLNDRLTVRQHLQYFQVAYGLPSLDRATDLMEILHLTPFLDESAGVLSGGTRQKLNLTLALMHDPAIALLDEPYQGFDWNTYLRFWDLTDELRSRGRCVFIVSHLAHDTARLSAVYRLSSGVLRLVDPNSTGA
ncbi:ABC transporter ATP-binding protein [Saccharothrix deserti]|uniref:ABC transporter ATP-binding protein n=1 Tax=Saccharothrix deserti TaxID=2593674 RepID=UPI00131AD019|nr:ABC transporter ATP-binding protein [Saccharothrix deserti]